MTTHGTFTFDTFNDSDCQRFDFESTNGGSGQTTPNVLSDQVVAAEFCWDNDGAGRSSNTGPTQGQGGSGDGFVVTECSSPGANNDEYTMEFDTVLDASAEQWQFNFYTLQRGNATIGENLTTCEVQISEDGGAWTTIEDVGGVGEDTTDGTDWTSRSVDLSDGGTYVHASTRVRLLITTQTNTQAYYGDYGVDTVSIVGTPSADIDQEGYRFYDDGTESGSVARQDQDTVDTIAKEIAFQLRILLDATGDPGSEQFRLDYKEASDGVGEYRKVSLS